MLLSIEKTWVLAYYKIYSAILLFVNSINYCQIMIQACFMYIKIFWQIKYLHCFNNYIYNCISLGNIPTLQFQEIIAKISIKFF